VNVLIFECDEAARVWLEAAVRARGHGVIACSDPEKAREAWAMQSLSLLILDWAGIDGAPLCRQIRSTRGGDQCVILAAGLSDRPADLEASLDAGADDYLSVPADASAIEGRLAIAERRVRQIEDRAKAEGALRDQYTRLSEATRDVVMMVTAGGDITSLNPAFERLTGWAATPWIGRNFERLVHPEDQSTVRGVLRRAFRGHVSFATEVRLSTRSGGFRVVELSTTPELRDDEVVGALGIARDITARKRSQLRDASVQAVAHVLEESPTLAEGAGGLLHALCVGLGWEVGVLWMPDGAGRGLRCVSQWHLPSMDMAGLPCPSGQEAAPAEGLLSDVLREGDARWARDMGNDLRLRLSGAFGAALHSALLVPIPCDGEVIGILELMSPEVREPDGELLHLAADIGKQVGQLVRGHQSDARDRRAHDPLTGLANRTLFVERLRQALTRGRRQPQVPFAVLFIDLDRFKLVNDSLGHLVGDQLLIAVARRLETCLRPGDAVGRFGGDEFAVLLDPIREASDATRVAERIQSALSSPLDVDGHEVFTSASIGIAFSATGYGDADDILRDADTAMYRAKGSGKARHEVFDEAMRCRVLAQLQVENDLRRALERGEFRVLYQPIVWLASGQVGSFEALLRWHHPERGVVLPADFVPLAEETGLIVPIGQWVLRQACAQARSWQEAFPFEPPLGVSVNVSGRQFADAGLVDAIARILADTGFKPEHLRLEITEGVILQNTASVAAALERLQGLGVHLDIDDFGTGYSSLSYLHRFPAEILKIDRSFVATITAGEAPDIARTILSVAHHLGKTVIAEGVETELQASRLRALHCEQAQGNYFAEPLEPETAQVLLQASWRRWTLRQGGRLRHINPTPSSVGRAS
jgi:diguanylate cyclase (GGDEF)-like protein/PAS domain S-box-containing protein